MRLNNLSFFDFLWNAWTWIATCVWFFFLVVNVMITWFVLKLQSVSQILKHLCDFLLPQCWFGYYSRLSAPKYAWLNIGEGEGHICERTKVSGVKTNGSCFNDLWRVLYLVGRDEIIAGSDQGEFFGTIDGRYVSFFFFRVHKVKLKRKTVCWIIFHVWQNDRWK